jgi:protein tyrosine/serine phosphatase
MVLQRVPMLRFLLIAVALGVSATLHAAERDPKWAAKVEQPGLPNLHRVTPNLYRSAQPTADGLRAAEKLGIKTVICLRAFHADTDNAESTKLRVERIRFNTWHPEDEDVVRFLKLITKTRNGPFLVHCQHGADRTGTMIAIYRIAVQGWKKDDAIREMTGGGYGYHEMWSNLIRYLKNLDIDALKKKAGMADPVR